MATLAQQDFDPADNHDAEIYAVTAVFLALACSCVGLRLLCARMRQLSLQTDDYLVIVSMIFMLATCIFLAVGVEAYGVGRHVVFVSEHQLVQYAKMVYAASLMHPCTITLAKIAILVLYRRIFVTKVYRWVTDITIGIVALWWGVTFFLNMLHCQPIRKNWYTDAPGHCANFQLISILEPLPWIITDFSVLIMPMPMVAKLQMPLKEKIALGGVFLLGGFTCIASVLRYVNSFWSDDDLTYTQSGILIWTIIEAGTSVICACLIVMKPIYVAIFGGMRRMRRSRSHPKIDDSTPNTSERNTNRSARGLFGVTLWSRSSLTHHTTVSDQDTILPEHTISEYGRGEGEEFLKLPVQALQPPDFQHALDGVQSKTVDTTDETDAGNIERK